MTRRSEIGTLGEEKAREWLVKLGYTIREENYKKRYGEVDIIVERQGTLHFIEVKTNKYYPESAFPPEIRINAKKAMNLRKVCETYLRETSVSREQKWQIDVISVILDESGSLRDIKHFENAIFEEQY